MDGSESDERAHRVLMLTLVNRKGLHARAAARFVQTVEAHKAGVSVIKDGQRVDGRSIMGLLMLGAPCGSTIEVHVAGDEADNAAQALTELVGDGFGERD
ncbi:MAG: HPr family phosphocarrier protein [Pseudomonadota bacterium]